MGVVVPVLVPSNKTKAPEGVELTEILPTAEVYQNTYKTTVPSAQLAEINEDGVATWFDNNTIGASKSLALHRDAPIGTIIKLTSVLNNKTVYVKVVGNLPKDDQKLKPIIEISKRCWR